jgi:hypothetical protein
MKMIRHEAVGGAYQAFTDTGMNQQFAEPEMKTFVEPARHGRLHTHRPVDRRKSLVAPPGQAREMVQFGIGHDSKAWGNNSEESAAV